MDADAVEIRVLGCMLEKERTTPDVYPLTMNALRAACNQSNNRDPVVAYDEETIRGALHRLVERSWARLASGPGSRAVKYRHLLDQALELTEPERCVLCVLMLRGAQTAGELKARADRLHPFASIAEVHEVLDALIERELVARLPRQVGQKEERYVQLLGGDDAEAAAAAARPRQAASPDLEARLSRLEEEVATLRQALESLARMSPQPPRPPHESSSSATQATPDTSSDRA
jgi:uncharacterized protein YceH (UPF0502 family)